MSGAWNKTLDISPGSILEWNPVRVDITRSDARPFTECRRNFHRISSSSANVKHTIFLVIRIAVVYEVYAIPVTSMYVNLTWHGINFNRRLLMGTQYYGSVIDVTINSFICYFISHFAYCSAYATEYQFRAGRRAGQAMTASPILLILAFPLKVRASRIIVRDQV